MLYSLALVFLGGILFSKIFTRYRLPGLIGMIILGIAVGPHQLNLLDDSLLSISKDLRQIALVIILTRAGLTLNVSDLKKIGRPAILLSFLPASIEILACAFLGPLVFGISTLDAAIMGAILSAVSPAIVVPRMISLIGKEYGNKHRVPQTLLAGASVDDIFVITLFTALLNFKLSGTFNIISFLTLPISIILGLVVGALVGKLIPKLLLLLKEEISLQILAYLAVSFAFLYLEEILASYLGFSGLIAIISMSIIVKNDNEDLASTLLSGYNRLWIAFEILLFVLVGVTVDLSYAISFGILPILFIGGILVFRMLGVFISLIGTTFSQKEKLFAMISYCPKATVQAAIGGIPLLMGLESGNLILTLAVVSILLTAPLGALAMDKSYKRLLNKDLS